MWNGAGQREREQQAFMKIKNSLVDNATLVYYEVGAKTEVIVDASPVVLGAMLNRRRGMGTDLLRTSSDHLVLLNRCTVRRNEKH